MNLAWPVEQEPSWSHKEYKKNWIRHCTIIAYSEKCSVIIGNGCQIGQRLQYKPVYRLYNLQDIFLYKSFSCYIRVDSNCACFSRCSSKLWVFCYFHESFDEVVLFQYLCHIAVHLSASFFTALQGGYPSAPRIPVMEPSETSVATLVSMGFDRDSAIQALVHARNDINTATNMLLESQSR